MLAQRPSGDPPILSLIIPVYNEAAQVGPALARLIESPCPIDREWIVVDDASDDGSAGILDDLARKYPIRVITNERNLGKGASVIRGLASTARVITSAALIMISVFGGFVLGDDPFIKMFGLGLAPAIFVDATIVRIVLVPATMKLLGDNNWWIPAWLDRLIPHIDIDGDSALPSPEFEPAEHDAQPPALAGAAPPDPGGRDQQPAVARDVEGRPVRP